jgi:hypothetical protein
MLALRTCSRNRREVAQFLHRFCAGVISHIRIAGTVDNGLGADDGRASFGCNYHACNTVTGHHGVNRARMNQVFAADLVQGIEHHNFQVINITPQLVLTDPDGLVAVGPELLKNQLVDF